MPRMWDAQGRDLGYVEDETDRARARAASQVEAAQNASPGGTWTVDANGQVVYRSPGGAATANYTSIVDNNRRVQGGPALVADGNNPSGFFRDQPGRSVGGQIIDQINARIASGQPIDQAWSQALWQRTGMSPAQAAAMHQFGANFSLRYGRPMASNEIDEALGQVLVQGQAIPNEAAWRSPPVAGQPAAGAQPGSTVNQPGAGAGAGGTGGAGGSAGTGTGGAGSGTGGAAPTASGSSANHFLGADSAAHRNDLIKNNKGDLGVLAERLLSNQETAQGGRFAAPIRSTYGNKAQGLEGLLSLESAVDPTFTDPGTAVGDVFNQNLGAGSKYDQPGHGLGKDLLTRAVAGGNAGGQAFLKGDPAAQLKALKAALGIDRSALLANQTDQQADEAYKQWLGQHASDPTAVSAFGSFLEFAKAKGLF